MTVRVDCLRDCSFSRELQAEWLQLRPPALQTQPCQTNEDKAREKIGPAVSEARLEGTGRQAHLTPAPQIFRAKENQIALKMRIFIKI